MCGLFLFFIISTCWANKVYTDPKKPIIVGKSADNFTIELQANPTTGYMWFLKNFNDDLIAIDSHHYVPPKDKQLGAAGTDVWKFVIDTDAINAPQLMELEFVYTKPWNLSNQKSKVFTVLTTDQ